MLRFIESLTDITKKLHEANKTPILTDKTLTPAKYYYTNKSISNTIIPYYSN